MAAHSGGDPAASLPGDATASTVPALYRWLEPALGRTATEAVPAPTGPRSWWGGPLDVEGLALGSVQATITSLHCLLDGKGEGFGVDAAGVAASFASLALLRVEGRTPEGFAPLSGFFPAADGWVRTQANYPHHAAALQKALGVSSPDRLADALLELPALRVEELVRAAGGVAAAVRSAADWASSPMGQVLHDQPWISFTLTDRAPSLELHPGSRLAGVRVLDLTRVIAGPTGTRLLAALGADVLRIDPPHLPELLDQHLDTGFAKRSALADLRKPDELARVNELLGTADVLFTGYRPGALACFGLDPAAVRARYPQLVVVTLDAWGQHGPWRQARGFDSIVQAATGIAHLYGGTTTGSWRPGALPVQALDHATGYGMAAAALALLARRARGDGAGSAHLSLAATAQLLLGMPGLPGPPRQLDANLQSTMTHYGTLVHATLRSARTVSPSGIQPVPTATAQQHSANNAESGTANSSTRAPLSWSSPSGRPRTVLHTRARRGPLSVPVLGQRLDVSESLLSRGPGRRARTVQHGAPVHATAGGRHLGA